MFLAQTPPGGDQLGAEDGFGPALNNRKVRAETMGEASGPTTMAAYASQLNPAWLPEDSEEIERLDGGHDPA